MKILRKLAVLLLTFPAVESAPAALLTFDDLPPAITARGVIPNGYGGVNWSSDQGSGVRGPAYYYNKEKQYLDSYAIGVVSGLQAASSLYVKDIVIEGSLFHFQSAFITAAQTPHNVTVIGYNGPTEVHRRTIGAVCTNPVLVVFNFTNVTTVVIHVSDTGNSLHNIILDDITITTGRGSPLPLDSDRDGVPDEKDAFPNSRDVGTNIIIGDRDTGVVNFWFTDGTTISDLVYEIAQNAKNHGQFVSEVAQLKNKLQRDGILTATQAAAIQECAARSRLP